MLTPSIDINNLLPSLEKITESLDQKPSQFLVIYDENLLANSIFQPWLNQFSNRIEFSCGEELKSFENFENNLKKIINKVNNIDRNSCVISVGGGSLGDFCGFFASIYKRGLPLVTIPSTWLACMDSAHGGKTALNFCGIKNQIGTFYPPQSIFIVKELLESLEKEQIQSAYGECIKMALLEGGSLLKKLSDLEQANAEELWQCLPELIEAKYRIVEKDPFERKNIRQILNLGHSLGHVFEASLNIPHGLAVAYGLDFSLNWSYKKKYLGKAEFDQASSLLSQKVRIEKKVIQIKQIENLLKEDKKISGDTMKFVFLKGIGCPKSENVSLTEVVEESKRQGWC